MKYRIQIMDFGNGIEPRNRWHLFTGRSLEECWRIAEKHARRGIKLYGGKIQKQNWGMTGGKFPSAYRSAVIKLDA